MPAHITETIYGSDQKPYAGPLRFSPCGEVRVVSADVVTGEPVDLVIVDGELDVTLTEGYYLVRMRGSNDFYIEVPAGDGEYQLYELMVVGAATPPVGGGIITTSPQDLPLDDATVARLNIGAAGLADVIGSPLIQTIVAARELTAEEVGAGTPVTPGSSLEVTYLNLGNRYRALNGEKVQNFNFWLATTAPANCAIYIESWRRSLEGRWRRVWSTPNVRGTWGAGPGASVSAPLAAFFTSVQNGDFFAIRLVYTAGSVAPVLGDKSTPADPLYNNDGMAYARLDGPVQEGADWTSAPKVSGRSICFQARNEYCPAVAVMGFDQFLVRPESDSIYYPTMVFSRRLDLGWLLETYLGLTTRNAARRGGLMADQTAIWNTDLALVYPRVVVIHASARADIKAGTAKATWLAALTNLIEQATNYTLNAGLAVVVAELPFTDPEITDADESNTLNRTADEWMRDAHVATLAFGEDQAAWLDPREVMGTMRAGGDSGNVWSLRSQYDSGDGMTLTRHGITQLAIEIGNGIKRYLKRLQSARAQRFAQRAYIGFQIIDADAVLGYSGYPVTYFDANSALTAERTLTLPTAADGVVAGTEYHFFRTASGAFDLNIGAVTSLAQNEWCRVAWDYFAGAWKLVAKGLLT